MPNLYGKTWTRDELQRHVGDITQVGGVRRVTLSEGREEGVETILFRTGAGLDFVCLPGRGMDISNAEFKGQPLAWRSATADSHAAYYENEGLAWLRSFYGGLVVTCGLTAAGAPNEDAGEALGLHGRISNTPAYAVHADGAWEGDDYVMWAQGKMRESIVFGPNLEMTRRISAKLGETKFLIRDRVENLGYSSQPLMLLYHINGGFPAIAEGGRLLSATRATTPRDAEAVDGHELYAQQLPERADIELRGFVCEWRQSMDGHHVSRSDRDDQRGRGDLYGGPGYRGQQLDEHDLSCARGDVKRSRRELRGGSRERRERLHQLHLPRAGANRAYLCADMRAGSGDLRQ